MNLQDLQALLDAPEGERLEFKEAKGSYEYDKLVRYCVALSNEGGGHVVLGATDKRPRRVVGTRAFEVLERTRAGIYEKTGLRVESHEIAHPDGRVVVFRIPARPQGQAVHVDGAYWMRAGDALIPMQPAQLKAIFAEFEPDFSAEKCSAAVIADLEPRAIAVLRERWARARPEAGIERLSDARLLEDSNLVVSGKITFAAIILLGNARSLSRLLPQAEVCFEYRSSFASGPAQQRTDHREGFLLWFDSLWSAINARNDLQHFQAGLFLVPVPTFHERTVREAVLNAVTHRNYANNGSIFVRQYPRELHVVSPGGLPAPVTLDTILDKQSQRNRLLAETFQRCGFVERAGQGMNLIFEECIRNGKSVPDFSGTDDSQVLVRVPGLVKDPRFLRFLELVGQEQLALFGTEHFLVLDLVHREQVVPERLKGVVRELAERGVVEHAGRGKYLLSKRFFDFLGQRGTYTRRKGLDRETNKALLLKHIRDNVKTGSRMDELMQVLPARSRDEILKLLNELRRQERVYMEGRTRSALWFPREAGIAPADSHAKLEHRKVEEE